METEEQVNAVPQEAHLFYQGGRSDKVYDLKLQQCETGWSVYAAWGRRGSTLQSDYKCERQTFEAAFAIYDQTLRSKLSKGYQQGYQQVKAVTTVTNVTDVTSRVTRAPISKEVVFSAELLTRIDSEAEFLRYLKSPRYFVQTKRDGVRLTIVAESLDNIYGYNKLGQVVQLDPALREATVKLMALANVTGIILDGEWEASGFWAWDLLHLGYDTRGMRYEDRLDLLQELLTHPRVEDLKLFRLVSTARTEALKLDLYRQCKHSRAEGVCVKNKDAQYRGGRNGQHYKYKFETTGSFIVGEKPGNKKNDGHRSMAVYLYEKGRLRFMATCKVADRYPLPEIGSIVEVRYLYAYAGGSIAQPVYFGVQRTDVLPEECTCEQLKYKQSAEEAVA